MQHVAHDTSASAANRYNELLRFQPPHERLRQAVALGRSVRELAVAGIRQRSPGVSDQEIQIRLASLLYGPEATRRSIGAFHAEEAFMIGPIDIALLVARAIEQVGGAYFVGGSLASSFQGEPRATNDIDMVVQLPLSATNAFVSALGDDFEVDVDMLRDALIHRRSCNIFFLPAVTKIDLFAVGTTPFDEVEFSRRKAVRARDVDELLVLKTPEDTVLRKLLWYREGGEVSEKQWRDLTQVLRISGNAIDFAHMASWAERRGISALFARARVETGR